MGVPYGCGRFEHVGTIQQHSHCDPLPDTRNGVGFMIFMPNLGQQAKRDPNDDIASHSNKLLALYPDMVLLASMDLNAGFLIENIQSKQTKHWFPMTIHYHTLKKPTKTTTFHYVRWLRWLPSLHSPPAPAPAPPPAPKRVQVCRWMGSTASVVGWTNPGSDLTWEAKPWAAWAAWAVQWRHKVEHLGENMWT